MIKDDLLQSITEQIQKALKSNPLAGAGDDMKNNIQAVVRNTLNKMDFVTREVLDEQQEVIRHTRERLQALEKRVAMLEKQLMEFSKNK